MRSRLYGQHRSTVILPFAVAILGVGQSLLLIAIPVLTSRTGLSLLEVSFVLALGTLTFLIGSPFWGRYSDRHGRRGAMLLTLTGFGVSNLAFVAVVAATAHGLLSSYAAVPLLVIARIAYGLTASGIHPVGQAWLADLCHEHERLGRMAQLSAGLSAGRLLGPLLGMGAVMLHPLAPLWLLPCLALPALAAVSALPARLVGAGPRSPCSPVSRARLDPRLWRFALFAFVLHTALGQVQYVIGPFLQWRFALTDQSAAKLLGTILTVTALATLLVQLGVLKRFQPSWQRLLLIAPLLVAVGTLIAANATSTWTMTVAVVGIGVGVALAVPAYTSASMQAGPGHGAVAGVLAIAHTLGYTAGALLAGACYALAPSLPFWVGAALVLPLPLLVRAVEYGPRSVDEPHQPANDNHLQ